MSRLNFNLEKVTRGSKARAASFQTLHGEVKTPIFMPVGTQATVRTLNVDTLHTVGANVLLANTYHLLLRPGAEVFKKVGGIHKFMNWNKPVLTDSGGFQIFSLPNSRKMTEEGAIFRSYVDGENILLSPEISIEMQKAIGSDIMMVLDECVPSTAEFSKAKSAMEITHRWAARSLKARGDSLQSMFGIMQGACFPELRRQSAKVLTSMPFDGFAIGGLAVGETKEERNDFCELSASLLPEKLPRYLMGVGTPLDLLEAVHRGVDMFDCTIPVELAQRGVAFTSIGKLQIHRSIYKFLDESLDYSCACRCCKNYSKAYLHHLIKANEILGWQLIAEHNLTFYHQLMQDMRDHILLDTFESYYRQKKLDLSQSDNINPSFSIVKGKKDKRRSLGDYEIIESADGKYYSVRQKSSGEVMHSVNSPSQEAEQLYIKQSYLEEALLLADSEPLVLWDVGLGAATNSMAAIAVHEKINSTRRFTIYSFENDLAPLRLALKNHGRFPHLFHRAPMELLKNGTWISENGLIQWKLILGNFQDLYASVEYPNSIFYDPFSYKTDGELWTSKFFTEFCFHLKQAKQIVTLYTYSGSTGVRSSLLGAGFFVAKGVETGPKAETTIAFSKKPILERDQKILLNEKWLEKWKRSDAKFPMDLTLTKEDWESKILSHEQFQ